MTQRIPMERAASRADVEAAIRALTEADKVRIHKYARLKASQVGREAEELVQEAMASVLDPERRRWDSEHTPFLHLVLGAVKSMASSWAKQRLRRPNHATLEQDNFDPIEQARSHEANPELTMVRKDIIERIRAACKEDQLATEILDGWKARMARGEIMEILDIDGQRYDTAARRVRRRAEALFPGGSG